jgi:hypothetical protein
MLLDCPVPEEKARERPFSSGYERSAHCAIRRHIGEYPPFVFLPVAALTRNMLKDVMLWGAGRGVPVARINRVLLVPRMPARYALRRGR